MRSHIAMQHKKMMKYDSKEWQNITQQYEKACSAYQVILNTSGGNTVEGIASRHGIIICKINSLSHEYPEDKNNLLKVVTQLNQLDLEENELVQDTELIKNLSSLFSKKTYKRVNNCHKAWIEDLNLQYGNVYYNFAVYLKKQPGKLLEAITQCKHALGHYKNVYSEESDPNYQVYVSDVEKTVEKWDLQYAYGSNPKIIISRSERRLADLQRKRQLAGQQNRANTGKRLRDESEGEGNDLNKILKNVRRVYNKREPLKQVWTLFIHKVANYTNNLSEIQKVDFYTGLFERVILFYKHHCKYPLIGPHQQKSTAPVKFFVAFPKIMQIDQNKLPTIKNLEDLKIKFNELFETLQQKQGQPDEMITSYFVKTLNQNLSKQKDSWDDKLKRIAPMFALNSS